MADISHSMGSDLDLGPSGDVAIADDQETGRQRVLRRLLTNRTDYVWQQDYGGGLARLVGDTLGRAETQAIIRNQLLLEAVVARLPLPTIAVAATGDGTVSATITYTDAATGSVQRPTLAIGTR